MNTLATIEISKLAAAALVGSLSLAAGPADAGRLTSLAAQDRTKQSAHEFLDRMWDDRPEQIRVSRMTGGSEETTDNSMSDRQVGYIGDDCQADLHSRSRQSGYVQTRIDWSRVSQVDRSPRNPRYVRVYGGAGVHSMIGFSFPSEADAARVETAMEFLRQECARAGAF